MLVLSTDLILRLQQVESGLLSEENDVKDEDDERQDVDAADVKSELNNHVKDMIQD